MNREVQAVVLLLVGVVTLRVSLTDTYLNYVKEAMQPWLIASGVALILLGVAALIDVVRGRGGSEHHGPRSAWLLLLPVATVFLVAPPALGAFTAARESTNAVAPASEVVEFDALPSGDPVSLSVADYVSRAVWGDGKSLAGRSVELEGFVLPAETGKGWELARLMLACCAADAKASKVQPVEVPPEFASLPANQWVTITGTFQPNGQAPSSTMVPWLKVTSMKLTKKPKNPYE